MLRSYGLDGGWKVAANNRKLTHDFTTPLLYLSPNYNVKLWPPNSTHIGLGLGWTQAVKNGTSRNVDLTFLCDFYAPHHAQVRSYCHIWRAARNLGSIVHFVCTNSLTEIWHEIGQWRWENGHVILVNFLVFYTIYTAPTRVTKMCILTHAHHRPILHRLATMHRAADRQIEWSE